MHKEVAPDEQVSVHIQGPFGNSNSSNNHCYDNDNDNGMHSSISTVALHLLESKLFQEDSPTLFEKCCGFFKVPRIGLAEFGRLDQWLNVPTQGRMEIIPSRESNHVVAELSRYLL